MASSWFYQRASAGSDVLCSLHGEKLKLYCQDDQKPICLLCHTSRKHKDHTRITSLHGEKLKLYCQDDQKPICLLCHTSRKHKDHTCCIIEEAAQDHKTQSQQTEKHIKEEFKKLHQLLQEEEEARMATLKEEEEQKSQMMKEKIEGLSREISTLSDTIRVIEEELKAEDISFLQNYKATVKRAQCTLPDPQLVSGALIDVAKHLGNLTFRVWEKMKERVKFTPVILDPNTASPWLSLSDDLTSVRNTGTEQQLPDNPERNTKYSTVLGSEGFSSGQHSWEVEVGDHPDWNTGVAKESAARKGECPASPAHGIWAIVQSSGKYIDGEGKTVTVKRSLQRIRVQLDYDRGEVSFYDPEDMIHIYTYKDTFTEKLYPFLDIGKAGEAKHPDIKITQSKVSLSDRNQRASAGSEALCRLHNEKLKLFCLDDKQPVCLVCQNSRKHKDHILWPIDEATQDYKVQTKHTEKQIKKEFDMLHQSLHEEEEARIATLKEEVEQKSQMMKEKIKGLIRETSTLLDTIRVIEEELKTEDISFLQNYKATVKRAQFTLPDPQLVSGALIDVAKHLGNLTFSVWEKMKERVKLTPVILDPNTASPWLSLSDDLTTVRNTGTKQQLPDNPERNTKYSTVLGSEGFSSGQHSWEVEVGDHPVWNTGVAKESAARKGECPASPDHGIWAVTQSSGEYTNGLGQTITVKRSLQRIRVQLDYDRGEVSFYDPEDMTHIYTHKDTFTEKLYPYISIGAAGDAKHPELTISQSKVSLSYQQ
ncbi:uncharacterized protein FYW47_002706 [Aplochiton taeniatus]